MTDPPGLTLEELGWNPAFAAAYSAVEEQGLVAARVTLAHAREVRVHDGAGEWRAAISGKVRHTHVAPTVGDWVAARPPAGGPVGSIEVILPRKSVFSRRAAGTQGVEQVLAANVDVAFVVMGLDGDYNLRRLERFLALTYASGSAAVIILSKADLCTDLPQRLAEVAGVAPGVPVLAARLLEGPPEELAEHVRHGRTVVLLGSSGVGKSTLINRLLSGDVQKTRAVRASDHRGRHTTSNRQLFAVPGGGLVIDSPGLREIQLWNADEGIGEAFDDIDALAPSCHFRDCRHEAEPGCVVRAAVEAGTLLPERLASYHKLSRESLVQAMAQDAVLRRRQKQADRSGAKLLRKRIAEKKQ
jgi:ribosome biogenesis GTPase